MTDVNYLEYGANAVRVLNTGESFTEFLSQNAYVIGVFLAVAIVIIFVLLILIFGFKTVLKFLPKF